MNTQTNATGVSAKAIDTSLRQGLTNQFRVLHALMMRELITRYGRDNLGVLWLVGEPMIFTLGVTTIWSAAGFAHGGTGIPIVAFAVTGYSSILMWRNATSQCSAGIEQNKPLLFHRGVRIIDVFLTRIALEIVGASTSFLVLSCFFIFIGWMPAPQDMLLVLAGWVMLAWFGMSLALLVGAGTAFSPTRSPGCGIQSHICCSLCLEQPSWLNGCQRNCRKSSCICRWCMGSSSCGTAISETRYERIMILGIWRRVVQF